MNNDLKKDIYDYKFHQKKYMVRHQTLCVTLSKEKDADIISWLGKQENRSEAVRRALREVQTDGRHICPYLSDDEVKQPCLQAPCERPQGEWIKEDDEKLEGWYRCSKCGRRVEDLTDDVVIHAGCEDYTIADIYPYCHCGADMRGTEDSRISHRSFKDAGDSGMA